MSVVGVLEDVFDRVEESCVDHEDKVGAVVGCTDAVERSNTTSKTLSPV